MLNLARLRGKAAYADGRRATGAEAYATYRRESETVFRRVGGRIDWRGKLELTMIGPQAEHLGHQFHRGVSQPGSFAEMLRDPSIAPPWSIGRPPSPTAA